MSSELVITCGTQYPEKKMVSPPNHSMCLGMAFMAVTRYRGNPTHLKRVYSALNTNHRKHCGIRARYPGKPLCSDIHTWQEIVAQSHGNRWGKPTPLVVCCLGGSFVYLAVPMDSSRVRQFGTSRSSRYLNQGPWMIYPICLLGSVPRRGFCRA